MTEISIPDEEVRHAALNFLAFAIEVCKMRTRQRVVGK